MTDIAVTLRELHRIHRNLTDLRGRLASGPRQIKVGDASIERFEKELGEKKEIYKRCRMTADEKELQLKEREQRVLDIRTKLNSCSTNKEYQTFIEQIAADEQANSVLSDEILELFDKVREHETTVKESGHKVAKATEELQKTIEEFSRKASTQTRWLLILTVVLTVLTTVMTLLVGWQIYLQVQPASSTLSHFIRSSTISLIPFSN